LIIKKLLFLSFIFIFTGCSIKQPIKSRSATIIFKTPNIKFYDKGFITKYEDKIHLQIFNVGRLVLDLKIYKDEVCQGTLQCINSKEFNSQYFHKSYKDDFLYNLFSQNKIYFKDRQNGILIKVK
jgi:hypothetical protein